MGVYAGCQGEFCDFIIPPVCQSCRYYNILEATVIIGGFTEER